jgi:hypothetical protein
MATTAQYTAQPIIEGFASAATADTSRSNPTTSSTALAAGPTTAAANGVGKRILRVTINEINAVGANTAGVLRFWIAPTANGTKYLLCEKAVVSTTSSTTAGGWRTEVPELVGLILPGAASNPPTLFVSSQTATAYHIVIESGLL